MKTRTFNLPAVEKPVSRFGRRLFGVGVVFLWSLVLGDWCKAQAPLNDLVFTVGTTIRTTSAEDWSYVMIGSVDPSLLRGKRFAVYGKAGPASSANALTLRGTIFQQTDPGAINGLMNDSVSLGQNPASVAQTLDGLLRREPGITNQSLPQKILTLFRIAGTNADTGRLLSLLAVQNPGLKLALGQAFAQQITEVTTYEVREINPGTDVAGDVIGRVTITPLAPVILPAPDKPFQVVTNHPDDDLVIRLRWGTPVELRRLSLLSYGYNLWRMPRTKAESAGFHLASPTLAQLYSDPNFRRVNDSPISTSKDFSAGSGAGAADDPADRTTYFVADNNNRRKAGGQAFADGEEFYYFVTARDILGRDGLVSLGGFTRACRRVPPLAPTDPSVRDEVQVLPFNGSTTNEQRLRVLWKQNTNAADAVTHYWVYRWPNPTMAFTNDAVPLENRIGVVAHAAGAIENSYLDDGATAPTTPGLSNFWYTIRAVSMAACDPLLSPHSPPASGVLRQREGPEATTGTLLGSCGSAVVVYSNFFRFPDPTLPRGVNHYRFTCERTDPGIAWVQFVVTNNAPTNEVIGPIYFPADGNTVDADYQLLEDDAFAITVTCTAGTAYGKVSKPVTQPFDDIPDGQRWGARFVAGQVLLTAPDSKFLAALNNGQSFCAPALDVRPDHNGMVTMRFNIGPTPVLVQAQTNLDQWFDVGIATPDSNSVYAISYPACLVGPLPLFRGCIVNLPFEEDCAEHIAYGAAGGSVAPIQIKFPLTRRTREYRLYRQVNEGALTLMSQGAAVFDPAFPNRTIIRTDDTMPVTPARLCYYVQLLDEHGNPSPMAFIGCKEVKPPQLPTPLLAEPLPTGTSSDPEVALNWFCPTGGVHRFKLFLERVDKPAGPSGIKGSKLLAPILLPVGPLFTTTIKSKIVPIRFSEFQFTSPVGPGFGPGPQFSMNVNVEASVTYRISIAAVDAQGSNGPISQAWEFAWEPPAIPQVVAWPFRQLPPVGLFHAGIQARLMTNMIGPNFDTPVFSLDYPVGVRIGAVPSYDGYPFVDEFVRTLTLIGHAVDIPKLDPNYYLFHRAGGTEGILPIALYRQQVTNVNFPRVSGDVTQVSPMLEKIAVKIGPHPNGMQGEVMDQLIARSGSRENIPGEPYRENALFTHGLFLLDAQPVISGATYRYFVVHFKANREMDQIIPAGEVTIP